MKRIINALAVAITLTMLVASPVLAYTNYRIPPEPVGLLATPISSTEIYLTWEKGDCPVDPPDEDTLYTAIFAKSGSYPTDKEDEDAELIYFGNDTAYTHSGLNPGTTYYYHAYAFDTAIFYYSADSFKGDTLVYTPTGNVAISTLEEGDEIYTYDEALDDGTLVAATIFDVLIGSSITNTVISVGANSYYTTDDHIFYTRPAPGAIDYIPADDVVLATDLLQSDATTINPTALASSSSRFTSYNIRHYGENPNFIIGTDRLVVGTAGMFSDDYDYDFATTLMGSGGIVGPPMPPWWFQIPECTAYEKLPVLYPILEEINETYEISLGVICVIFTFLWILLAGVITFMIVHTAFLPIMVMAILITITAIAGLVPLVFILPAIILGGIGIFMHDKLS